jgi:ubiquitin-conjugating enzyme E2 J2
LPDRYPFAPPRILMNTPNGRFATNTRLCFSFSDWHPESWNPAWGIRTVILGLISFFYETRHTLGAVKTTAIEKSRLAEQSIDYNCRCLDYQRLFRNNEIELSMKPPKIVVIKRKTKQNIL